jgi:uncharacterized protein YbbC (DUF1343 family)
MLAASTLHKNQFPFIVLDRPNPLNGTLVQGPMLNLSFSSFVGRIPLPLLHGMTIGELSLYFQKYIATNTNTSSTINVQVIRMNGWERTMSWESTNIPWILTSPNMPTIDTVRMYPGMCLIEGTTLSEGRGTTKPFQMVGGDWLNYTFSDRVRRLHRLMKMNIHVRETYFIPTYSKCMNNVTTGVSYVFNNEQYNIHPMKLSLTLIAVAMIESINSTFSFINDGKHFDQLLGNNVTRLYLLKQIYGGGGGMNDHAIIDVVNDILLMHDNDLLRSNFIQDRLQYLLY